MRKSQSSEPVTNLTWPVGQSSPPRVRRSSVDYRHSMGLAMVDAILELRNTDIVAVGLIDFVRAICRSTTR